MEKERVMKHAAPSNKYQEWMFDFIEESFRDDAELLTTQETEQFWEQLHQKLEINEMQEVEEKQEMVVESKVWQVTEKVEEHIDLVESDHEEEEHIVIDQSSVIRDFLNINIRILFLVIMSINIVWMQYLSMRYGSRSLIQIVKWLMIIILFCYMISWKKPYVWFIRKRQAHD